MEQEKIKSPEQVLQGIKNFFTNDRKCILRITIILGIITHFLLLSNLIWSPDGLLNGIHYTAGRL